MPEPLQYARKNTISAKIERFLKALDQSKGYNSWSLLNAFGRTIWSRIMPSRKACTQELYITSFHLKCGKYSKMFNYLAKLLKTDAVNLKKYRHSLIFFLSLVDVRSLFVWLESENSKCACAWHIQGYELTADLTTDKYMFSLFWKKLA